MSWMMHKMEVNEGEDAYDERWMRRRMHKMESE
jgi:hypothetical protein